MNATELSAIAGIVLSLILSYVPGLRDRWAALDPDRKRFAMLCLLALLSVGIFGASCGNWISVGVSCDQSGAMGLTQVFIAALIANQAAYQITPAVKA